MKFLKFGTKFLIFPNPNLSCHLDWSPLRISYVWILTKLYHCKAFWTTLSDWLTVTWPMKCLNFQPIGIDRISKRVNAFWLAETFLANEKQEFRANGKLEFSTNEKLEFSVNENLANFETSPYFLIGWDFSGQLKAEISANENLANFETSPYFLIGWDFSGQWKAEIFSQWEFGEFRNGSKTCEKSTSFDF